MNAIAKNLKINGFTLNDFDLPNITEYIEEYDDSMKSYKNADIFSDLQIKIESLKDNQKIIFDVVVRCLKEKQQKCIFVDGPGGSGNSYLLKAM